MTETLKKAVETLCLLIILMLSMSSSSQKLSDCEFNFTYSGQHVVYNFKRLSRQESWQATNGKYRVSISVCHTFQTPIQCQNSSVCVSSQQNKMWNIMISNSGAYRQNAQSTHNKPVLELVGTQSCGGSMNYTAEIYFNCSIAEQNPVLLAVREDCTLLMTWQTAAACPVDKGCVFGDSDFSSLHHPEYYEVQGASGQKFQLNLCGPVHSGACNDTSLVAACEIDGNNAGIIGQLDTHHVVLSDKTGLTLIYKTSAKGIMTHIQFICNPSAANISPKFMNCKEKIYLFEVETPLACKAWPKECMVLDHSGGRIDLSPLRKNSDNWFTQPTSLGVKYYINVCGPLNSMHTHKCTDGYTGACRTNSNSSISLGFITRGPRITESNTVILKYTGGSPCPNGGRHSMQIEFLCSKVAGLPVFVKETNSCVHHFSWETTAACLSLEAVGQNCTVKEMQYGHIFNLTVLHSPHDGYSLMTEQGDSYLINVCGPLNRSCNGQEASVCLTTQANNSFAVGHVNRTVLYDNGGLRFVLHGEGCKLGRNSSSVIIILLCRQGSDLGQPELYTQDDCNFYFIWYTRAACPPHKSVDCTVMHDGQLYDLSQLADSMNNHVVVQKQLNLKFLLNVCHSVVFGKDALCQYSSAACLINLSNPDTTSRYTNIGDVKNGPYFEDGMLKLKYVEGNICNSPGGPDHTSTIITFECSHDMNYMPELLPGDMCVYEFLWRTPNACPLSEKTEQPHKDDSCTVVIPGTDNRINLQSLRNKVKMVSDLDGHNYTFVVCGNLSSSLCGNSGVGVCQFKAQDLSQFWNAGVGNSHLQYSMGGVSLEYTDGAPCNDMLKRSTKINFVCVLNDSERIVFRDETDSCTYLIIWYTDLACSTQVECSTPAWNDPEPINLTPLIRLDHNYKVQIQKDTVLFINVCHPLLPVQGLNCPGGSSACIARLHNGSLTDVKSLGVALGPVKKGKGKASIMYVHGSACNSGLNYSSKFDFECDPKSGQGEPKFMQFTDDCQYQFVWMTSMICEPFIKNMSVSEEHCFLINEQVNARMSLETLGQHGMIQVQGYTVDLCNSGTVVRTSDGKPYGTLSRVQFDYQQQQVQLLFTKGANCTSTEQYGSQLLLNCDEDTSSSEPRVLMKNDCWVVFEWPNAPVCEIFIPEGAHSSLQHNASSGSLVGLVVGLIVLMIVLCLVLYLRKPENCSQLKSRVSALHTTRHNGWFHYSQESDDGWSEL